MSYYGTQEEETTVEAAPTEAEAIINIATEASKPIEVNPGEIYLVPDGDGGKTLVDTDEYLDIPRQYLQYNHEFDTVDSFLNFVHSANEEDEAQIWAHLNSERSGMSIKAVIDPHTYERRRASLAFTETARWREWKNINERFMSQATFADFIESHAEDITSPDAATMLEIAQSIRATIGTNVEKGIRLDNGQTQFVYKEDIEGKAGRAGQLEIPDELKIAIQPFVSSGAFAVTAKFRYRIVRQDLEVGIKFLNTDLMIKKVYQQVLQEVRDGAAGIPIYEGQ